MFFEDKSDFWSDVSHDGSLAMTSGLPSNGFFNDGLYRPIFDLSSQTVLPGHNGDPLGVYVLTFAQTLSWTLRFNY